MNDFGEHLEVPTSPSHKNAIYKQPSVVDFLDDHSKETRANAETNNNYDEAIYKQPCFVASRNI